MSALVSPPPSPVVVAKAVGLRYVSNAGPGLRRQAQGDEFIYLQDDGKKIMEPATLRRLKALGIPPAWSDVWICPQETGHLQATGRDARGRKQYRYHERWREVRDESKYERMMAFSRALPKIRRRVARDLKRTGLPREKVLAAVVRLLETSLIRVGNHEYAQTNKSYGLTTMRNRHAKVRGGKVIFDFIGKSGKSHHIELRDEKLAKIIGRCQDLPGQELFGYAANDGNVGHIRSEDVNGYLHEIAGDEFSAKDFRTWAGTILAAVALVEFQDFSSEREAKSNIVRAISAVATMLGNTPAICRKSYIHPAILESYLEGQTISTLRQKADEKLTRDVARLHPEEAAVMMLLRERLRAATRSGGRRKAASL